MLDFMLFVNLEEPVIWN